MVPANQYAMKRSVLTSHADVSALDFAILDQAPGDEISRVDRDRETDSLRWKDDRRVDADDLTVGRDEGSSRIAGIQSRIGLDHIVDQTSGLRSEGTSESADDSRCHRCLKTIRVSDG